MVSDYSSLLNQINTEHDAYKRSIDKVNESIDALFENTKAVVVSSNQKNSKKTLLNSYKKTYFSMVDLNNIKPYNFQKEGDLKKEQFINSTVLGKIRLDDEAENRYEIDKMKLKSLIQQHLVKIGALDDSDGGLKSKVDEMLECFVLKGDCSKIVCYLSTRTNIYLRKTNIDRSLLISCFQFYGILIQLFSSGEAMGNFIAPLKKLINSLPMSLDSKTKCLKTNIAFFIKLLELSNVNERDSILDQIEKSNIIKNDVDQLISHFENIFYSITPEASRESCLQYFIEAGLIALDQLSSEVEVSRRKSQISADLAAPTDLDFSLDLFNDNQLLIQLDLPSYLLNFHETLACPISHTEMNILANPAVVLGCGHIFGQSTVRKLIENFVPNHEAPNCGNYMISCPYCKASTSEQDIRNVQYVNFKEQVFENFVDYFD
ncbi:hypothetical protein QEN19_001386 [Hanseniaspora menglaensis]